MARLSNGIVIEASPSAVWGVLGTEFGAIHRWLSSVSDSSVDGGAEPGPGCARTCAVDGVGEITERVTEWKDGEEVAYRIDDVMVIRWFTNRWTVQPHADGSLVELHSDWETKFGPLGSVMDALFLTRTNDRAGKDMLEQLKAYVEAR